jgi:hypothetical protein
LLQQTSRHHRLREATDRRCRQACALCNLAIAQQIRARTESPKDVGSAQQGTVDGRAAWIFFEGTHGKMDQGLPN